MNLATPAPSSLERRIICVAALVLAGLILWAVAENQLFQTAYVLGGLATLLVVVLGVTAWRQGLRWFLCRRALWFYAWLGVGLASVIVLYYTEENWRGQRAWGKLQREARDRGNSLDFSSIIPPRVSPEQNFALAPGVPELLGYPAAEGGRSPERTNAFPLFQQHANDWPAPGWTGQEFTGFRAWDRFFQGQPAEGAKPHKEEGQSSGSPTGFDNLSATRNVVERLSGCEPQLAVWRAASRRPEARYPYDYTAGYRVGCGVRRWDLPSNLPRAAQALCLRASADLLEGQTELALEDVLLALRLADSARQEPFAFSHAIRAEMLMDCLQTVWEGLAARRWTAPQLARLQENFAATELLSDYQHGARG